MVWTTLDLVADLAWGGDRSRPLHDLILHLMSMLSQRTAWLPPGHPCYQHHTNPGNPINGSAKLIRNSCITYMVCSPWWSCYSELFPICRHLIQNLNVLLVKLDSFQVGVQT
jgi:hypothetical protein